VAAIVTVCRKSAAGAQGPSLYNGAPFSVTRSLHPEEFA
jgi:hypothetical protein